MRFIKIIIAILFLSAVMHNGHAQNLVPNPSFEIYTICPTASSQISYALPWQGVPTNSTDYYNSCSTSSSGVSVPCAAGGHFQNARTGVAYAGIWVVNGFGGNYREYLRVKIDSTLEMDSCYAISFYCNLSNGVDYGVDKIGAYISNTGANSIGPGSVLQYTPQIVSHTSLTDTVNWMRISGYYHAGGGEQYITIGNFSTDANSDTSYVQHGMYNGSYYLIDDVSITKITACDTLSTGINELQNTNPFNLYPNPNNGNMTLAYTINAADHGAVQLMDCTGRQVATYILDSNTDKLIMNCSSLDNGIYFYRVWINNKTAGYDKFIIMK